MFSIKIYANVIKCHLSPRDVFLGSSQRGSFKWLLCIYFSGARRGRQSIISWKETAFKDKTFSWIATPFSTKAAASFGQCKKKAESSAIWKKQGTRFDLPCSYTNIPCIKIKREESKRKLRYLIICIKLPKTYSGKLLSSFQCMVVTEKSHILKQSCSFELQVCLSTYGLFLQSGIKTIIKFLAFSLFDTGQSKFPPLLKNEEQSNIKKLFFFWFLRLALHISWVK